MTLRNGSDLIFISDEFVILRSRVLLSATFVYQVFSLVH